MRVYNKDSNIADLQVENGTFFLLFDVTKTTGAASLPAFFGDLNLPTSDTLKVLYTSRTGGQRSLIPSLPVLPLAIAGTMGPQHIKCYFDSNGNINRVVFPVMIGAGGALTLDNNSYLSVSTNFGNLASTASGNEKSLRIYAVDTVKSNFAFMYESIHLNASSQKAIDLTNSNQLILSKEILDFQLLAKDTQYSVNWSEPEIEAVSRAQNDLLAMFGKDLVTNRTIQGASVASNLGFEAVEIASGGTYYNAIGVSDFITAKVTSRYDDRAYVLRVVDTSVI
ncbi:hypothetical protein M2451_002031 [Dysgonomonas sp. PFB1-18]|uniref:hypothetical protein n=1 Tax=unclassified Dysgonomonas TaxID=2630389 RepID=UPI0024737D2D|nr:MULTISPECIES: hypothetical protein [unclassified Dysgonomonas]MDH6309785.1 hypothetical protein [Dysgonomonas sp. PF1-14]MDH6339207.1 hypothetical protein [Dysgonomonas sp. PF1-16]MDH6380706.1 hypothetical protein [Dysgonomonas sp. PFB1-18]MDH6398202.1 hypothetical protein [Dysgonomonas sp. PF1-23]